VVGQDDGYQEFCSDQWSRLVGALDLYCGDLSTAEELAQEALLRAGIHWNRVRYFAAPGGWAYHVAVNLARSRFRRHRVELRAQRRLESDAAATNSNLDIAEALAVREALRSLPPRQREVVVLRYYLGYPVADAANALGISDDALRALAHRAITRLRQKLRLDEEVPAADVEDGQPCKT
jgi:RNA polymerase sigma factor (sigma-70 family)